MTESQNLIAEISEQECWVHLRNNELGRLATVLDGEPDIFPVNYYASESSLLFRTATGAKLASLIDGGAVALEVDRFDRDGGWSIVVRGKARLLQTAGELADAESAPLRPWIPNEKPFFVRIEPTAVTGRRVTFDLDQRLEGTL